MFLIFSPILHLKLVSWSWLHLLWIVYSVVIAATHEQPPVSKMPLLQQQLAATATPPAYGLQPPFDGRGGKYCTATPNMLTVINFFFERQCTKFAVISVIQTSGRPHKSPSLLLQHFRPRFEWHSRYSNNLEKRLNSEVSKRNRAKLQTHLGFHYAN